MDTPTTPDQAARALLTHWDLIGNPTERARPDDPDDLAETDPWLVLTRRDLGKHAAAMEQGRAAMRRRDNIDDGLPPIVITMPLELMHNGWSPMTGDPSADLMADQGWPGWRVRVGTPVRPARRPRVALVGDGADLLPEPRTTHALAVATLGARYAADLVRDWAGGLPADDARRARAEADAYDDYAATTEALIAPSAAWLVAAEDAAQPAAPAFPVVPAEPRRVGVVAGPTEGPAEQRRTRRLFRKR